MSSNKLTEKCGMSRELVKTGRTALEADRVIRSEDGPNNSKIWSLVDDDS